MKKLVVFGLFLLYNLSSFGQDKASLTKEETVNYIKKKISEIEFYNVNGSDRYFFNSIDLNEFRLRFSYNNYGPYDYDNSWCGPMYSPDYNTNVCAQQYHYHKETYTYEFDITKIEEIIIETSAKSYNDNISFVRIIFKSDSVKKDTNYLHFKAKKVYCREDNAYLDLCVPQFLNKSELTNHVLIPFYSSDTSNFNKIKKALEHLKDLCKAEDDPFGE